MGHTHSHSHSHTHNQLHTNVFWEEVVVVVVVDVRNAWPPQHETDFRPQSYLQPSLVISSTMKETLDSVSVVCVNEWTKEERNQFSCPIELIVKR